MALLRLAARSLLAGIFVIRGWKTLRNPDPFVKRVAERNPVPPLDPALEVRVNGAVMLVAGSALAAGVRPRLSASALAAALVPTTFVGHPFWAETTDQGYTGQRVHFEKNLAMLGGLLLVALTDDSGHKKP